MFVESTSPTVPWLFPAGLKTAKPVKQKVLHWITDPFQSQLQQHQVMAAYYPWQIAIQLISKAVSMTGTLAWHLEIVLQLKIHPLGFSALWRVCVLRSPFRSGLSLQGYSGEKKFTPPFSLPDSIRASLMIFIVASTIVLLFWWFVLPSRRRCGGGASTNQNCRAALCSIQRFLWGTEAWYGGEVTSDETSSTPDHLDPLRAMKLQPDGRFEGKRELTSRTTQIKCIKVRGDTASGIRPAFGGSHIQLLCCWIFLINIHVLGKAERVSGDELQHWFQQDNR